MSDASIRIPLTKGEFAIIDPGDLTIVDQYSWQLMSCAKYATSSGKVLMHRLIMNAPKGAEVDHINGNGLDNRRANLRFCTRSQNSMNRFKKRKTNPFKGITFSKAKKKWVAQIRINRITTHLGYFDSAEMAALTYNNAAIRLFGEFARPNEVNP